MRERRSEQREVRAIAVEIEEGASGPSLAITYDLSQAGALLLVRKSHHVGERLKLRFSVPEESELPSVADAEVVRIAPPPSEELYTAALGVRFIESHEDLRSPKSEAPRFATSAEP